jgi:hypothetical protein
VPELGSLGSVRGALSNGRPYREQRPGSSKAARSAPLVVFGDRMIRPSRPSVPALLIGLRPTQNPSKESLLDHQECCQYLKHPYGLLSFSPTEKYNHQQ